MEKITITILPAIEKDGHVRAGARAMAQDVKITLEGNYEAHPEASKSEIKDRARV